MSFNGVPTPPDSCPLGTIKQSEKVTTQTIEVLNTSLLDLYSIRIAGGGVDGCWRRIPGGGWRRIPDGGVYLDRFLPTKGVLNCDKLIITKMGLLSDMTVAFAKWLHWKQERKNSRRHLIFEHCILPDNLVSWLKEAFLTATSPVNYVISFVQCEILISDMEFNMENKETGEQLTILKFSEEGYTKTTFQIWRRIPVEDDNQKNLDAEHLSMLSANVLPMIVLTRISTSFESSEMK
ncbi:hypothetical protein Ddc_14091 [Ditylenchus destructor]|nr:hypothetical protein Ddc_14091 [Ditylenchus destructor]